MTTMLTATITTVSVPVSNAISAPPSTAVPFPLLSQLLLSAWLLVSATLTVAQTNTSVQIETAEQASTAAPTGTAAQFQEWSAETRTSLSFRVNADTVRALLPAGWTVSPHPENPQHTALTMTFMNRQIVLDAEGKAVGSGNSRYMVMSVLASNTDTGQRGTMIVNGISPEGAGSYQVYQQAVEARAERAVFGSNEQYSRVLEVWQMEADSGDQVTLSMGYQQGVLQRQQSSVVIRSGRNTAFTRTYKIDQASDALGLPDAAGTRIEYIHLRIQGPLYSRLFDGTEVLTAITSIPWYHREIFIP